MNAEASLPSLDVVATALRVTTERLAAEVAHPQPVAPEWNEFEWAIARAVCAMHGISGLLATRLRWRGPAVFRDFLHTQHANTVVRNERIGQMLQRLDAGFRAAGCAFVGLKGSAVRALQLHQCGERPQSDIDLLVRAPDLARAGEILAALGYELRCTTRRHQIFMPHRPAASCELGEHPDNPIIIEVHTRVAEALPVDTIDITESIFPRRPGAGANSYLSRAALMRNLCLHAAGNMRANAMRFLQIFEISRLACRMTDADWQELVGDDSARSQAWWLFPPLVLAARYVPDSVPTDWLNLLGKVCPFRLRRRYEHVSVYEVSWSNLRIAALPGNEWSRDLGELLRLARSRLWPSRVDLDELASAVPPQLKRVRWYGVSHVERIARWIFTRVPRVQTLAAVSAAIGAGSTR